MKLENLINNNTHNTFGGLIYESDFCTEHPRASNSSSWADRVASAMRFDEQCKKAYESKLKEKKYKEAHKNA